MGKYEIKWLLYPKVLDTGPNFKIFMVIKAAFYGKIQEQMATVPEGP